MKKILIFKSDKPFSSRQYEEFSDYIQCQYANNKPIVLPNSIRYELVECSSSPQISSV